MYYLLHISHILTSVLPVQGGSALPCLFYTGISYGFPLPSYHEIPKNPAQTIFDRKQGFSAYSHRERRISPRGALSGKALPGKGGFRRPTAVREYVPVLRLPGPMSM